MSIDFKNIKTPYLIAEIGINHNGDLQLAKKLIDAASACQWDCVKFQKRDPDISVPEHQKNIMRDTPWGRMTYLDYKKRLEFGKKEFDYIDQYCKEKPIDWTASVWDIPSLRFIANYNVPFVKIPSAQMANKELVLESCKTGKPLVVSTGMSSVEEIDEVVDILEKNASQYILLHCNSAYPTPKDELNLNCIKFLQEKYKRPVGYSGHECDLDPTVYSTVLGVRLIERHITLDHAIWGTDQASSLEPMGMDMLRKRIKDIDAILGNGVKRVTNNEVPVRKKLRGDDYHTI
ncbi:MAG: N-acetylneuraminate synthase family protein [Patescibacteria group bacterium]